jgi:hypothetical protein
MEKILCLVELHCGFEMAKRVKGYVVDPWVLQLRSDPLSLFPESSSEMPEASMEYLVRLPGEC